MRVNFDAGPLWAAHNPLLPQPQERRCGKGELPIKNVAISFGYTPVAEDHFASAALASFLSGAVKVPEAAGTAGATNIVLHRTGAVEALPGRDDRSGPKSRESYELRVSSSGAEIRARSSAGLYYAVQTIRQLVEERGGERFLPEVEMHDWPSLPYRGFIMDMSHGPLPAEDEIIPTRQG